MIYKLEELVTITSSKRIFYAEYQNHGIPFYRSKEIIEMSNNKDISTQLYISQKKYDNIKLQYGVPKKNDILMTAVGTIGTTWLVDDRQFYFKDGNLILFTNYNEKVYYKYLYYYFQTLTFRLQIDKICIGSTQKALTIKNLKKLEIDLPSIKIQKKIVNILDIVNDKIKLNNQINNNLSFAA